MDVRQLQITKTAISDGWINLRPCGFDFFPKDAFGKSTKKDKGRGVSLYVKGFDHPIVTDLPTDLSGRPRWFFRDRSWTRQFVHLHKLRLEDKVNIVRLSNREYRIEPLSRELTFIDLFAGIGGMRLAFEKAGCRCVFTSEWDKFAQQTYEANFGEKPEGDIRKISSSEIPEHDILVAGFPCQPFSISGVSKKNALGRPHGFLDVTQGTLFFEIQRIIEEKRPRAFLLENVKNLRNHDNGRTFKIMMDILEKELNYSVHAEVLDGCYYVPQHRERIMIVGFREPTLFEFPRAHSRRKPKFKSILDQSVPEKYTLTEHLWEYLQKYARKHQEKGNGFGFGLTDLNGISRTLSARYYKDGSEILIPQNGSRPRRLTPLECARLMGFTQLMPNFVIPVSDMQAYKQFGNSVVVPLIHEVAKGIVKAL